MTHNDYSRLLRRIQELQVRKERVIVAIDGRCGSGKTTLAEKLSRLYGAPTVHMDDFFLPPELRTPERLNQPGGNIHYERFLSEVLPGLIAGRAFSYGSFDCHRGVTHPVFLPQSPVRIVEGSYALHPRFEESYRAADALTVFLCVSPAEQLRRIEAIADPYAMQPQSIMEEQESRRELYDGLKRLTQREQTYLLYRYGFTDGEEHPLIGTAIYFHLTKGRAKKTEEQAMDNLWLELPWWFI